MKPVKNTLLNCIEEIVSQPQEFLQNPKTNFTRHSRLSLRRMLLTLLGMGGQTLSQELVLQGLSVTSSAFVQRRYQIKPEAFYHLFETFTSSIPLENTLPILAADGSDVSIPTNPSYKETYFPGQNGEKAYNLLHLNALYDLENGLYMDLSLQGKRESDERQAVIDMMGRSPFRSGSCHYG